MWVVALLDRFPEVSIQAEVAGWPLPDADLPDEILDRRARVTVTWEVPEDRREEFVEAMIELRRSRRRTGARRWSLASDVEHPDRFVETFMVDSWHDHLEQHEVRQSPEDVEASDAVRALVGPPVDVAHYVEELG